MKRSELSGKLDPKKDADKDWYLALLDGTQQQRYEEEHLAAVLSMLKLCHILPFREHIREVEEQQREARGKGGAESYRSVLVLGAELDSLRRKLDSYKCFFTEPYFARMDVVDDREGYNSYYIGKHGDVQLEIVDWRAPLAVRYYQKSCVNFKINDYDYRTVLRRALSVKNGKVLSFRNEYLSVKDVLTEEEIAGRDEEILFDPYLRDIISDRKDDVCVRDIIRTIQEKQFAIVTLPERESFVLQGCAGSGKTMIMLHRLSYLMYNNEALHPKDVLVITPSVSFNTFIDELAQVLELQRVSTVTLKDYFFDVLKNEGLALAPLIAQEPEDERYLTFLYSEEFPRRVERELGRIRSGIQGLFASEECREVVAEVLNDCAARQKQFSKLKNASVRVRRRLLGEMKEDREGKLYFTKPLRGLMSAFVQVEDFLRNVLGGTPCSTDRFLRRFSEFYRCAKECASKAAAVLEHAEEDLGELYTAIGKEISDLKRYRLKTGSGEQFTYAEGILRREELARECAAVGDAVRAMEEGLGLFEEFFRVLSASELCAEVGRCASGVDLIRFYYRRTVKQYKREYGVKGLYASDGYALCAVLAAAGRQLSPRYGLVFVDEGQDVSASEYALLEQIHSDAAFNIFGDLGQNITPFRGVGSWERFGNVYELGRNYRNTNEIVEYVTAETGVQMSAIGLTGGEVQMLTPRKVNGFFRGKQGLKAVIMREEYLPLFAKKGFCRPQASGKLSRSKINVLSVYESKGLEFTTVAVYDRDMTPNEKYIACTRALKELGIIR